MVVVRVLGLGPVVLKIASGEHGDEVGGGHRRGRVAGAGRGAAADRVDAQLLAKLAGKFEIRGRKSLGDGHITPSPLMSGEPPETRRSRDPSVYGAKSNPVFWLGLFGAKETNRLADKGSLAPKGRN